MRHSALITAVLLILLAFPPFAMADSHCGTSRAFFNRLKAKGASAMRAAPNYGNCTASDYYDSVYTTETEHFQIFYTLDYGPHATQPEFIDSLAASLESAFHFHTKVMGMRPPEGVDTTIHFKKPVKEGLFPVEVAELDFLSDPYPVFSASACNGCYGVTYSQERDYRNSEVLIDNDFMYVKEWSAPSDSLEKDGKKCPYPVSTERLYNKAYNYPYDEEWAKGIRVTAFHEFFHAVQLQYMDLFNHWSYWIEASATGNEEIGAPDINDYFAYIKQFLASMGKPIDSFDSEYSICLLYLYLYHHVDKHFDKEIWELFEKKPDTPFQIHLKTILDKRNIPIDSLYNDFTTILALSGENVNAIDSSRWVSDDQALWPPAHPMTIEQYARYNQHIEVKQGHFIPDTLNYAYNYYQGGTPIINDYKGNASAILFKGKDISIRIIASTATLDSIETESFYADSIIWVFSRFDNMKYIPETIKDSTLRAYPMPWRGNGNLCFTPLPENREFLEIRTGRGELVMREPYEKTTHCIDGDRIKEKMKPGIYRFRAGSSGKLHKFLVIY